MFNAATLAATAALAPIALGETTTLGEGLITTADYSPAPSLLFIALSAAAFSAEIRAQGIEPSAVSHFVARFNDEARPVEAYVTTDKLVEDMDLDGLRYTRIL